MLGIHDLAMKKMVSFASDDRLDAVNLKVNQITKLSRTFLAQLEALNKHRGKGQQKNTVEHVTVNGRCRMHGGKSTGAPYGNQHALQHGLRTKQAIADRQMISRLLKESYKLIEDI